MDNTSVSSAHTWVTHTTSHSCVMLAFLCDSLLPSHAHSHVLINGPTLLIPSFAH